MALVKTVSLDDYSKEVRKTAESNVELAKAGIISGVLKTLPELVEASPVDTGEYASSWDFTVEEQAVIVGNFAPHAPIIEFGSRPFTPPIGPLLAWAKRVLKDPSQPPDYSEKVRGLAYGVQKKISQEGMKPRAIMRNMIPRMIENIEMEIKRLGG